MRAERWVMLCMFNAVLMNELWIRKGSTTTCGLSLHSTVGRTSTFQKPPDKNRIQWAVGEENSFSLSRNDDVTWQVTHTTLTSTAHHFNPALNQMFRMVLMLTYHIWIGVGPYNCPHALSSLMPRSHQTFCLVRAVRLLGIMFRNRCWPTTFRIITAEDVDGWCQKWPVWPAPQPTMGKTNTF